MSSTVEHGIGNGKDATSRAPAVDAGPYRPEKATDEAGGLIARSRELAHIDELLWQARRGAGGVVALHGEPGVGKTVLVEAAVARATEFRTVQVRGTSTAGLGADPLSWPAPLGELASRLEDFVVEPPPLATDQSPADAGPAAPPPEAAVEALATGLRHMTEAANAPLLVTVDDCQELPGSFVDALAGAVLNHLRDDPVGLILAWRDSPHLATFRLTRADVPQHRLGGLTLGQAVQLMRSRFEQLPSEQVLSELVVRSAGNPLVLADVYGRLTPEQLAGWHPLPDPLPVSDVVVEAFDVVRRFPEPTRRALTVAAAAHVPRDVLVAAMRQLGVDREDLAPAVEAGVVYERGPRIDFAHPLVRAAAFRGAPADLRRSVRRTLSDELARGQAIETSAYHAAIDAPTPDQLAARRLGEAAQVAIDRGDLDAAARHEEFAARFAAEDAAAAQFLSSSAAHWLAAGRRDRARYCAVSASGFEAPPAIQAEVRYQRARLEHDDEGPAVADRMVEAAELCLADAPNRAFSMLVDAGAWRVLAGDLAGAEVAAERAVRLAASISSHAEVLAGAVRVAVALAGGREVDELAERSRISLLIGQTDRFPSSPEVALVIGHSLLRQEQWRQADRWARWIRRCAERSGDRALATVPVLLAAWLEMVEDRVPDALRSAREGAETAEHNGTPSLAAWGWHLVAQLHALTGDYHGGFRDCANLFAATDRAGCLAKLRSLPALALLELQRRRTGPALAWARTALADLEAWQAAEQGSQGAVALEVAPVIAGVMLLARSPIQPDQWGNLLPTTTGPGAVSGPAGYRQWLHGACAPEPSAAIEDLAAASRIWAGVPPVRALVDLCWGVQLADAGRAADARERFDLVARWADRAGASGVAELARRELKRLPSGEDRGPAGESGSPDPGPAAATVPERAAEWELSLLGGFAVRHRGAMVPLPPSLATQAVKIVALQPRITADELIELLWEDAEPGVGARRLRNVLWRVRSACGDLLVREGNAVHLGSGAETDVQRFTELAERALVGADAGTSSASATARAALEHYRGELLPGDRYADWATGPRESVARTHLRLLDLLVDDALEGGRTGEALVLLDRLAQADPFNERHHLRMAEIHLDSGNRGRALESLERAERTLEDLGVARSPAVDRLRGALGEG
jgi:DNA-binding SARP family transcriptional activator